VGSSFAGCAGASWILGLPSSWPRAVRRPGLFSLSSTLSTIPGHRRSAALLSACAADSQVAPSAWCLTAFRRASESSSPHPSSSSPPRVAARPSRPWSVPSTAAVDPDEPAPPRAVARAPLPCGVASLLRDAGTRASRPCCSSCFTRLTLTPHADPLAEIVGRSGARTTCGFEEGRGTRSEPPCTNAALEPHSESPSMPAGAI